MTIKQAKTSLSVSCASSSKDEWTCSATLHSYYGAVAGETVSWSQLSGRGSVSFSSLTCTLSSRVACSINVTGTSPDSVRIEAVYSWDTNNLNSSASRNIIVK